MEVGKEGCGDERSKISEGSRKEVEEVLRRRLEEGVVCGEGPFGMIDNWGRGASRDSRQGIGATRRTEDA